MVTITHEAVDLGTSLTRALQYVNAWKRKSVVVKFGGSIIPTPRIRSREFLGTPGAPAAMVDPGEGNGTDQGTLIEDLVLLKGAGIDPVLVHGGGPEITRMLERLGKESRFVNGLRVTDAETMDVVEMVLAGRANKAIVSMITAAGGAAVGISGMDGKVFQARKLQGPMDLGQVGEVEAVDTTLIQLLSGAGFIPVVASIGIGPDAQSYNLNADHAAGALAAAMSANKFILLTDVRGVYRGGDEDSLISLLRADEARQLVRDGVISKGMIPKVEACLAALAAGVPTAHIISGRLPHTLLVELFTEEGVGTMLVP